MNRPNEMKEKGVALILALLLVLATTVIAVSLATVSRTEAFSSMNYRLTSQSRDAAEAGVHKTANFLMNSYTKPGGAGNLVASYGTTTSPVTSNGNPVILSASSKVHSNYPISTDQTSFNSAAQGSVTAGTTTVNYAASAQLLSMQQVTPYGSTNPVTIQTWAITSDGSVSGMQNADVEVTSTLEQQVTPVFTYAAFADDNGCSALTFGGGGTTDSYDSSNITYSGGNVVTQTYDGNVGTNGNLSTAGNPTTINGNLSTPRTGVGSCTANNVTAWTDSSGHVTGSIVELPQAVTYPTPVIPAPGSTNEGINSAITLPPGSYGDITLNGHGVLTLEPNCPAPPAVPSASNCTAGVYDINSISESGANTSIVIAPIPGTSPAVYLPVILNIAGVNNSSPVTLTGNSVQNPSLNPMDFQMLYAGTGTISLKGGSQASGLLYAPNASFSFGGHGDWFGAVIGADLTDMGGAAIHYDRRLASTAFMVGPYTLGSFSWKKY
jgi:Tfp pilus assembly protein PilX